MMRKIIVLLSSLIIFSHIGLSIVMDSISQLLPSKINGWHRSDEVQLIDFTNIFDYMNGGGELYLGYRFDHLSVFKYLHNKKNNILVEIYEMDTSDDAFGLLSLDWSGEAVFFDGQFDSSAVFMAPTTRALYGSGLLRLVTGKYYVRIMATRESVEARNTIIQIGKILYKDSSNAPEIVHIIPSLENIGLSINSDKIAFFRSHRVLNSLFYVSHQNILNLDPSVSAVSATYGYINKNDQSEPIQILIIEYKTRQKAVEAFNHFSKVFLPENQYILNINDTLYQDYFLLEEGWLACRMDTNFLFLLFNIPDKPLAEQILNHIKLNKYNGE
jgi:hypothetical protein